MYQKVKKVRNDQNNLILLKQFIMKKLTFFSFFSFMLFFNFGCENNETTCPIISYEIIDFSKYSNFIIEDTEIKDVFLVVNSIEKFNDFVKYESRDLNDDRLSSIDYSKNTLLIGKKKINGISGSLINQSVNLLCDNLNIKYQVQIRNGGYTANGNFYFGVIVPKVESSKVIFDIQVEN